MIVYKFGGASVKDANGVRNLANIINGSNNLIVIISAFGKTTNKLEEILGAAIEKDPVHLIKKLNELKDYHYTILNNLIPELNDEIYGDVSDLFNQLESNIDNCKKSEYDYWYDQIVSFGEILSTKIVSRFLNLEGAANEWLDARKLIITNDNYRDAKLNWDETKKRILSVVKSNDGLYISQGFLGGTEKGETTTLGREGSDYTAAIFANSLNCKSVTFWKDVPGILNADPEYFEDPVKLDEISYRETVELTYSGAKVIHPKTIKPLQNKNIPLYVRSFVNPEGEGTSIKELGKYTHQLPIYIVKHDQMLISITPRDFSFVVEESLGKIFSYFAQHNIKVNLMNHSAISLSVCVDNRNHSKVFDLLDLLKSDFKTLYNDDLKLITVRHYSTDAIEKATHQKEILLEHRSRNTAQFVIK